MFMFPAPFWLLFVIPLPRHVLTIVSCSHVACMPKQELRSCLTRVIPRHFGTSTKVVDGVGDVNHPRKRKQKRKRKRKKNLPLHQPPEQAFQGGVRIEFPPRRPPAKPGGVPGHFAAHLGASSSRSSPSKDGPDDPKRKCPWTHCCFPSIAVVPSCSFLSPGYDQLAIC